METRVAELEKMVYDIWETIKDLINKITGVEEQINDLQAENTLIKNELCKKDNSYSWCKIGVEK
jgi:peptidoglycan hydrolase CwlO-like protein